MFVLFLHAQPAALNGRPCVHVSFRAFKGWWFVHSVYQSPPFCVL